MVGIRPVEQIYDTAANKRELVGYYFNNTDSNGYLWTAGKVFLETVSVGPLVVQSQAIEAASTIEESFAKSPLVDGIIGLGFVSFTEDELLDTIRVFDTNF